MIILTTLGLGQYNKETKLYKYDDGIYEWKSQRVSTSLFQVALAEWFPADTQMVVLATKLARLERGDEIRRAIPNARLVDIPDGKTEAELWEIFGIVAAEIPTGEKLVLDITHGFRSLPILTLLALSFLRVAKEISLVHVLYGAREAREEGTEVTPVFDLTPFVTMLDWANATNRFLETGDARKIAPLISARSKSPLNPVARTMVELSEAIATARAGLLYDQVKMLMTRIEDVRAEPWKPEHSPLRLLIEGIESRFAPLARPAVLDAQWEQIRWLANHQQYPAAASLAREWLVSVRLCQVGKQVLPVIEEDRKEAENWLNDRAKAIPGEWREANELWKTLAELRNDLMHFGLRSAPKPPKTVGRMVVALPEQLRLAVLPLGIVVGEATANEESAPIADTGGDQWVA